MATPTEPVTTEPTGALFRALRSVDVEPNLAYEAAEENRRLAGENVVAVLGAKIAVLGAKIDAQGAKIDSQGSRLEAQITEIKAEIKVQTSRIDVLQRVIWRVIWPLIILLAAPVFGLLYKALTTG